MHFISMMQLVASSLDSYGSEMQHEPRLEKRDSTNGYILRACLGIPTDKSCQVAQLQDQLSNSTPANAPAGSGEDSPKLDYIVVP